MPRIFDTHCHLDRLVEGGDPESLRPFLARARAAGVERILTIATGFKDWEGVLAAARLDGADEGAEGEPGAEGAAAGPAIRCTVGVHPHEAEPEGPATTAPIVERVERAGPLASGIGESGLDYWYDHSPRAAQRRSFEVHVEAAAETGLPLVVHSRSACEDTIAVLREGRRQWGERLQGVIHCFSEGRYLFENALELGFHISFSGILTFRRAEELRALARETPADRLLVETDAPFLAPEPHRGRPNEPALVAATLARLAEERGGPPEDTARATWENAHRLFPGFPPPG